MRKPTITSNGEGFSMKRMVFLLVVLALVMSGVARADTPPAFVNPPQTAWSPPWVTQPPYQRDIYWDFGASPVGGPSGITGVGTPGAVYGGTLDNDLESSDSVTFTGSVGWFSAANSPDGLAGIGIWVPAGFGEETGAIVFNLDNTQTEGEKNIWIELTGQAGGTIYGSHNPATLSVLAPGSVSGSQVGKSQQLESGLFLQDFGFTVVPNPSSEEVVFDFSVDPGDYAIINSLQIATECVPEPSTLALLGIVVGYVWRRRKAIA